MKVKFLGASKEQVAWGGNDDPNQCLTVGQVYEVSDKEVHSWHTKISLVGFDGKKFNDASFEYERVDKGNEGGNDMSDQCEHDKVYANFEFTSYPPISPWICSKCGFMGGDRGRFTGQLSYADLVKKFHPSLPSWEEEPA